MWTHFARDPPLMLLWTIIAYEFPQPSKGLAQSSASYARLQDTLMLDTEGALDASLCPRQQC